MSTCVIRSRGFSLIEVMVALIVLSVGLLGIARMQSLALSSTNTAQRRSIAAIEAASLAAAMHENRGYWTTSDPAGANISVAGTAFTFTGAPLLTAAGSPNCASGGAVPCTPVNVAAYDIRQWATALQQTLPNDQATVACGTLTPVSCTITIQWFENAVAVNAQAAQQATQNVANNTPAAIQNTTYILYVQP